MAEAQDAYAVPENLKQMLEDPDTGPLMRITIEIALRKLAAGRELASLATAAGQYLYVFTSKASAFVRVYQ